MSTQQFENLVEEITRRVSARLHSAKGTLSLSDCQAAMESGDIDGANSACDSCRGCHVNRPDEMRELVELGATRFAAGVGHDAPASDLAQVIDHTLLKPEASRDDLAKICAEAKKYHFKTVCVNASNVRFAASQLAGSSTIPIAVVGFPLGAETANAKAFETREAVRNGAQEIDMVINIGALKSKDYALVLEDINAVVGAANAKPVKVILETCQLTHDEKVIACSLAKVAGAAFVKTSTGFGKGGATAEDIMLMREVVGPDMGVKASGGVRSTEDARNFLKAGATRLGASASVAVVSDAKSTRPKSSSNKRPPYGLNSTFNAGTTSGGY